MADWYYQQHLHPTKSEIKMMPAQILRQILLKISLQILASGLDDNKKTKKN